MCVYQLKYIAEQLTFAWKACILLNFGNTCILWKESKNEDKHENLKKKQKKKRKRSTELTVNAIGDNYMSCEKCN